MSSRINTHVQKLGARYPGPHRCPVACLFLAMVVVGCIGTVAQPICTGNVQQYLKLDTVDLIDVPVTDQLGIIVRATADGVTLYIPDTIVDSHRLLVRLKPSLSSTWRVASLTLPDSMPVDGRNPLSDCISVGDSTIILLAWNRLLRYDLRAGAWICTAARRLNHGYQQLWRSGEIAILGQDMYVDPGSEPHPFAVCFVNMQGLRIEQEILLSTPSGIGFTLFQPRRVLDVSRHWVALSDVNNYRVRIYNHTNELDTILERRPEQWTAIGGGDSADIAGKSLKHVIDELGPTTTSGSLIRNIAFISDSVLLVSYTNPERISDGILRGKQGVRFDLWKRTEGKWSPIAVSLSNESPALHSVVSRDVGYPMSPRYRCENGYIVAAEALPVLSYGRTWEEIITDANAYLIVYNPRISIVLQRWVIP